MTEFKPRTVSGGAISMLGSKLKNDALKAHNGKSLLVGTHRDSDYRAQTHVAVLTQDHELVCVMHQ